jgi:DNA sulfur modification protein DndB
MDDELKEKLLNKIVKGKEIELERKKRNNPYNFITINSKLPDLLKMKTEEGWEIDKTFKNTIKLKKLKSHDIYFEDRVWNLFANLGFTKLNKDRNLHIPYDKKTPNLSQQIDVLAIDDETIILVECKSAKQISRKSFKIDLEAMKTKINGLRDNIGKLFSRKLKFKYIFATENYILGETDLEKLKKLEGIHFDEDNIKYYLKLFKELGLAARYQLLGSLFSGKKISEMNTLIPAIKGKMGKLDYYSFSIEPEKLLKIGYVLHRNKANSNMMPTYQRLIKKNRLKSIHKFIEEGGYFPNSIILSIDAGKKGKLKFDIATNQVKDTISNIGILHLPQKYQSVYIIDGQHRLYGYANSDYRNTNTIPVVAFVNLDREEQIRLFMNINENQKAVSKNLRLTLNSDLLWTSENQEERIKALTSRIAIHLGENKKSVLYDRVSIGEDKKDITSESIVKALKDSNFLGKVSKNKIETLGTFYKGDLDSAFKELSTLLVSCFDYLNESLTELWDEKSIIVTNTGIYAIIRVISDIIDLLIQDEESITVQEVKNYLDPIIMFYKNISEEMHLFLRKSYGAGGYTKYWRTLQKEIKSFYKEFNPKGLDEYIAKEKREYNDEAFSIIRDIEGFFNKDFKIKLIDKFGENNEAWFLNGVPPNTQDKAIILAQKKKRETQKDVDSWECLHMIDYRDIALKNWRDTFENSYTRPEELKINGGKDSKTNWMVKLNDLRNKTVHSYSISIDEIKFLREIKNWLFNK